MHLLRILQAEGVGSFDSGPAYVDKLLIRSPVEFKGFAMQPPNYQRVAWEITDRCDMACDFCGRASEVVSWQSCQSCIRRDKRREVRRDFERPESFLAELADLEVGTIHIRGGNPLLEWDRLQSILWAAQGYQKITVLITTPGIGQPRERLLSLCEGGRVQLNIVMFGIDAPSYEAVCGRSDVLEEQIALVDDLVKRTLPFYLTFVLSFDTREKRHDILNFVRQRWKGTPSFTEVYWREALADSLRFSHLLSEGKPLYPWRTIDEFYFRIRANTCLYGSFEVGIDGLIRPCPGA